METLLSAKFIFLGEVTPSLEGFHSSLLAGLNHFGCDQIKDHSHGRYGVTFEFGDGRKYYIDYAPQNIFDRGAYAIHFVGEPTEKWQLESNSSEIDFVSGVLAWVASAMSAYSVILSNAELVTHFSTLQSVYFAFEAEDISIICSAPAFILLQKIMELDEACFEEQVVKDFGGGFKWVANWKELVSGFENSPSFEFLNNPYLFEFDETILFDPSHYSFGGKTGIVSPIISDRIIDGLSERKNNCEIGIAKFPMGFNLLRLIYCSLRVIDQKDLMDEILIKFQGERWLDPSDKLIATLSLLAFNQIFLDTCIGPIIIVQWPQSDSNEDLWIFICLEREDLKARLIPQRGEIVRDLAFSMDYEFGVGSYGETYRILPDYSGGLDNAFSDYDVVFIDGIWSERK